LLDSGTHVPLMIRFPAKYSRWAPRGQGGSSDRLVSFDDFAPTVLRLAGIDDVPAYMTGRAFLGTDLPERRLYVYGHRDRIDEAIDCSRSVRDRRYLYIRNYMPHLGYNQPSAWVDQSELSGEFVRLARSDSMTAAQTQFAGPHRPLEELYDYRADPMNLNNLAASAGYQAILDRMRAEHQDWMARSGDLGFLPEVELKRIAQAEVPMQWAQRPAYDQRGLVLAASRVGKPVWKQFERGLRDPNAGIRYWSALGMRAAETKDEAALLALEPALQDSSPIVQIEAAGALVHHGRGDLGLPALARLLQGDDETVLLYAARTVELLGEDAASLEDEMKQLFQRYEQQPGDPAWFIRFTTSAFLRQGPHRGRTQEVLRQ
ncbi:MAG: hypothetical protein MI861_07270, partial [Pirellulales bacterium]|nr:hypothetical protein [Pirellulales bacterium]